MSTDRLRADLLQDIQRLGGEDIAAAYLEAYEVTRSEHGVPHLPLALKRLANQGTITSEIHSALAELFHTYPYQEYLYPGVEQTITRLKEQGKVLLFSDGNAFFQPQKIYATSVKDLVDGIVVLSNKISSFEELSGYWPADRYVFIDDKQKVLDAAKEYFGTQATTVLVRQGRYASTTEPTSANMSASTIADVANLVY